MVIIQGPGLGAPATSRERRVPRSRVFRYTTAHAESGTKLHACAAVSLTPVQSSFLSSTSAHPTPLALGRIVPKDYQREYPESRPARLAPNVIESGLFDQSPRKSRACTSWSVRVGGASPPTGTTLVLGRIVGGA